MTNLTSSAGAIGTSMGCAKATGDSVAEAVQASSTIIAIGSPPRPCSARPRPAASHDRPMSHAWEALPTPDESPNL